MKTIALVLSCEHAVNRVPEPYQQHFKAQQHRLRTHEGFDLGALAITNHLSQFFACDFVQAQVTRLLIDCNRSLTHRHCFSDITKAWQKEEKEQLIQHYYLPFRQQIENKISALLAQGFYVLHLSIHSFTPVLQLQTRHTDIGLLYDPKRKNEQFLAQQWQQQFKRYPKPYRVRLNYPYRGVSDGFTRALRQQFGNQHYAGLEVETNQALIENEQNLLLVSDALACTLQGLLKN